MKKIIGLLAIFLPFWSAGTFAQETFPRNDVMDHRSETYALTNVRIMVQPGKMIENGTILVRKGRIEKAGANLAVPKGYLEINLTGKTVYPSFIDLFTNYGLPKVENVRGGSPFSRPEQIPPVTKGAYNANDAIKSHYRSAGEFNPDVKSAEEWRRSGFGAVLTFRPDGIARGTATFVTLGEKNSQSEILIPDAACEYSFNRGTSTQNYPRSIMGYVSLLRQTHLDAEWYKNLKEKSFTDQSLDAWNRYRHLPQIFDAGNWLNVLRADKVGDEFNVQYIIKGGGNEYQRVEEIKKSKSTLIIPLNFPDAYDVENPVDAQRINYADMLHWELAPGNAGKLASAEIPFVLTADGLKNVKDFLPAIRKSIKSGLHKDDALRALTVTPAALVHAAHLLGTIESGKLANFFITNGDIFEENTTIYQNWIQGVPYPIQDLNEKADAGKYQLMVGDSSYSLMIEGKPGSQKAKIVVNDSTSWEVQSKWEKDLVNFSFKPGKDPYQIRMSGWRTENGWKGNAQTISGDWVPWSVTKVNDPEDEGNKEKEKGTEKSEKKDTASGNVLFPFIAYGNTSFPERSNVLFKNATVWTNEDEGILTESDVLVENGKISQVGKNLTIPGITIIDATGKHLTAGIIDEHTHIAGGGNDVATNSSMVRIEDQVNSEDINIYRALAGGVTAAQVLHGSANPIGGQSALIKLRWGAAPESLKIEGADPYIKFALGENVKRTSNPQSVRFPQTRMGVEQVYMDAFTSALEYEKEWKKYQALSAAEKTKVNKPRRDLVHETMLEIIHKKRFITCHSYVQSEINMLMKVAEAFGFNVAIFTHILEGYKVADKMKEHGVAASSFSDWWNYKWEVRYAIPYNAAILHREGVLTAINSDDANMGRRLNQEAAKSIKYGGLTEEEALKLVTLNPAKMLHLDHRMGSIKVGKDADLVLWNDHPLSIYARPDKTMVDGIFYFDYNEDQNKKNWLKHERARLVQKMLSEKKAGRPTQKGGRSQEMLIHCNSVLGEENHEAH